MPDRSHPVTRRSFVAGVAILAVAAAHRILTVSAQDATPAAIGTPAAGTGIRPTGVGDVPSTGASRPGPANLVVDRMRSDVVAPVGLAIETAGIDAGIEPLRVV